MKRVLVMANHSVIVDLVALILAVEIAPDVLQLAYQLPPNICMAVGDTRSVLIIIDEGETLPDSMRMPTSFREAGPLLMIKASFKTAGLQVLRGHQLTGMEDVSETVRGFIQTYLKRGDEAAKIPFILPSIFKTWEVEKRDAQKSPELFGRVDM
jgi:hypothetical protein